MSSPGFQLVPLDCPTCGATVEALGEDVVYYCTACRNGYRFEDEEMRLTPVEVAFVSASHVSAGRYAPFWVLEASVAIRQRKASGGRPVEWLNRFFDSSGADEGQATSGKGAFVVPAFDCSLHSTLELTRRYTRAFPELGEKLGERLTGGCYGLADARKLAHFAVIASEVEKRDVLTMLHYDLDFLSATLLGVPLVQKEQRWYDGLFGVPV